MAWKFLKPSCVAASLRSSTSSFRSASTTAPTSLLASQTALRRFGVVRLLEDLADLAVGHLLAVDLGPEDVELLLDGVRLGGHLLEQLRVDLLFQVHAGRARRWRGRAIGSSMSLSLAP